MVADSAMAPPVDFETLVSLAVAGDSKVACETTLPSPPPDFPAESFYVPPDQQFDWIDRNAGPILDRDDSTKGPSNPKSAAHATANPAAGSTSTSQRFSGNVKRKDGIIGLPRKLRVDHLGHSSRRTAPRLRVLPGRRSGNTDSEPASPKVSCLGKILSDRERFGPCGRARKIGLFARLLRAIRCLRRRPKAASEGSAEDPGRRDGWRRRSEEYEDEPSPASTAPPPGLGAIRRFTSGRSWASMEAEELERSGPLDARASMSGPLDVRGVGHH